jgi:hypothetical protein
MHDIRLYGPYGSVYTRSTHVVVSMVCRHMDPGRRSSACTYTHLDAHTHNHAHQVARLAMQAAQHAQCRPATRRGGCDIVTTGRRSSSRLVSSRTRTQPKGEGVEEGDGDRSGRAGVGCRARRRHGPDRGIRRMATRPHAYVRHGRFGFLRPHGKLLPPRLLQPAPTVRACSVWSVLLRTPLLAACLVQKNFAKSTR